MGLSGEILSVLKKQAPPQLCAGVIHKTIDSKQFICYNVSVNKEKRKQYYCVCEGRSVVQTKGFADSRVTFSLVDKALQLY